MNIHQAINRIAFRMKSLKTNQLDQQALDALVDYINHQNDSAYMENLLFAKLFVEKFMSLAEKGDRDAQGCLNVIEGILEKPMYNIVEQFQKEIPLFKFQRTLSKYKRNIDPFNLNQTRKEHNRIAKERGEELMACFKSKWTMEQAIDFLKNEVNRLSKVYNKEIFS